LEKNDGVYNNKTLVGNPIIEDDRDMNDNV